MKNGNDHAAGLSEATTTSTGEEVNSHEKAIVNRRSFMRHSLVAGAAATVGAGILANGNFAVAQGASGKLTKFLKEEIMKTKYLQHLAILSTSTLLFPLGALARDSPHSVEISSVVQIGSTQLKPGNYKVGWQGAGPVV